MVHTTQSSYTPFLTENLYQGLRPFLPASVQFSKDMRSVHFLGFPEVRDEYFDADIERQVRRMQNVIELGRGLREKHTLSLKVRAICVFSHPVHISFRISHIDASERAPRLPSGYAVPRRCCTLAVLFRIRTKRPGNRFHH
jgi:valyl-tRNA synthetase